MSIVEPEGRRLVSNNPAQDGLSPYRDRRIQTGLSTQIIIKAQGNDGIFRPIGAIQSLAVSETRPLGTVTEVGTDGMISIVPNAATTFSVNATRIVFDYMRLTAAFGRGFRHLHAQRFPFDIEVVDYNPYRELANAAGGRENALVTRFVNCWFASLSYTYESGNFIISEQATINCETIYDHNNPPQPAIGGADSIELEHNNDPANKVMSQAFEPLPSSLTNG